MNESARILVVENKLEILDLISQIITSMGHQVFPFQNSREALQIIRNNDYELIITDMQMPEVTGMDILKAAKEFLPDIPVIIITAYGTIDLAVKVMKAGAYEFVTKPFKVEHLMVLVRKALGQSNLVKERNNLRKQLQDKYSFDNIVGNSLAIHKVFDIVERVANSEAKILITGESGTGKDLVARSIHARSARSSGPFISVNCGAIPEHLFESEIFGHEKGSFTGAHQRKIGLLQQADGGTFFLDEVFEMPEFMQTKLLHALQDRKIRRVGGADLLEINVRYVSATNKNPQKPMQDGLIREDFYYRLNVININLPALRERKEDIHLLAEYFLKKFNASTKKSISGFDKEVINRFEAYRWPGNIREMENVVERAVTLTRTDYITVENLPAQFHEFDMVNTTANFMNKTLAEVKQHAIDKTEREYLLNLLRKHQGNVSKTAISSGMTRRNIHRLLKRLELDPSIFR